MSAPTVDLLGALGLHPDQVARRRRERARPVPGRRRGPNKGPRRDLGRCYVAEEEIIRAAYDMHRDGASVRDCAREFFNVCYSASPNALANAFLGVFKARGWPVRSQSAATSLSNVKRTFRPRCSHVSRAPGRVGERCYRRCVGNDLYCWKHDPERIAAAIARLRGESQ